MSESNPTTNEIRNLLVDFYDWSEEEVNQLLGYFFRQIDLPTGNTNLTREGWEIAIMAYSNDVVQF